MRAAILIFLPLFTGLFANSLQSREFTVLVYNVENLFDIDGVSLFDDYGPDGRGDDGIGYSADLLGVKLDFVAETLGFVNEGKGPEVVLFQEFERDQTPDSSVGDLRAFLDEYEGIPLEEMLSRPADPGIRGLPSYAFLVKALDDRGLEYPYVAVTTSPGNPSDLPAHVNVVFSQFPITAAASYPTESAREVQVVVLDVEGYPFVVINNHWKSGASRPETEKARLLNAGTVRRVLDEILAANPAADVLIGGDLNSYYDQAAVFPEMERTGVNSVLGSQGDEEAVARGEKDLYNLWFELPVEDRYTEVWRDWKGTLMQMLVTPGLYDDAGIRYQDGSFEVLIIPGHNVDEWGRPVRFEFAGGGRGGSDHLPILARFETVEGDGSKILELENPGRDEDQPGEILFFDYDLNKQAGPEPLPLHELLKVPMKDWFTFEGKLFAVQGRFVSSDPPVLRTGKHNLEVYGSNPDVKPILKKIKKGQKLSFLAELGTWNGKYQWVVRDPSWLVGRRELEPHAN